MGVLDTLFLADVNPYIPAPGLSQFRRHGVAADRRDVCRYAEHSRPRDPLRRAREEEVDAQLGGHVLLRVFDRAGDLVAVGLQHVVRKTGDTRARHPQPDGRHSAVPRSAPMRKWAKPNIPLAGSGFPPLRMPGSAMMYFQFVFAAITPILIAGAVLGRMNFKAWMLFVPLWSTIVYSVGAFSLWGGGWLSSLVGAVDYSGGYVIHLGGRGLRLRRCGDGRPAPA